MQPKQTALVVSTSFIGLFVRMTALLSASIILCPLPALAGKIPVSALVKTPPVFYNPGLASIFLETTSVVYKGKFVYFQTEKINSLTAFNGGPIRTTVNHVMDCETGNWQIIRAIGHMDSWTEDDIDLTSEFQGKTFFAEPGTASGILYKTLCR